MSSWVHMAKKLVACKEPVGAFQAILHALGSPLLAEEAKLKSMLRQLQRRFPDSMQAARPPPQSHPRLQSKPRFTRGISVICLFICFVSAYYTRFSRITRNKVRVE